MDDKNWYQIAFQCIKLQAFKAIPTLKNTEGYIAMFVKAKKALIYKSVFLFLLKSLHNELDFILEVAYLIISKNVIYKGLMIQSNSKTPGLDKINF